MKDLSGTEITALEVFIRLSGPNQKDRCAKLDLGPPCHLAAEITLDVASNMTGKDVVESGARGIAGAVILAGASDVRLKPQFQARTSLGLHFRTTHLNPT